MSRIKVVTDSSCDIPQDIVEALDITVIPLIIHFGQETFREGVDITRKEFYLRMIEEAPHMPRTSQPSPGVFKEVYTRLAQEADHIIALHVTGTLSGTYSTSLAASKEVEGAKIVVVDSRTVSMSMGWAVIAAAEAAQRGYSPEEIISLVIDMIPRLHIPAVLETLEYIRYGGRIGKAAAFLGTLLNVKPILHIEGGEVMPLEKVRTRKKALRRLVEMVEEMSPLEDVAVMHTHAPETAAEVADMLGAIHPRENILIAEAGAAVGSHVGPGAVGVCCVTQR